MTLKYIFGFMGGVMISTVSASEVVDTSKTESIEARVAATAAQFENIYHAKQDKKDKNNRGMRRGHKR